MQITSPTFGQCVDLSQGFAVTWEVVRYLFRNLKGVFATIGVFWHKALSTDQTDISFRLTNYNGANPPINVPFPPGQSRHEFFDSSVGSYDFPGVSRDVAHGLANKNDGCVWSPLVSTISSRTNAQVCAWKVYFINTDCLATALKSGLWVKMEDP